MKVAVLGAGLMGKEVARDLVLSPECGKSKSYVDLDVETSRNSFKAKLQNPKLEVLRLDANDDDEITA